MRLLGHAGLRVILANHRAGGSDITLELDEEDENEGDDIQGGLGSRRRRRTKSWKNKYPPVPSEEGKKLMEGGIFGASEDFRDRRFNKKTRLARKLMTRELGTDCNEPKRVANALSQV